MAHIFLPDDLIDKLRPICETAWEREQREEKKKVISPTDVVLRALNKVYEAGLNKRS